ncbi:MAG: phosphodiester glycosidase family protein [Bacteroidetes bacterium]|nr:phosphodiester glycosidase family protein [Bacteroidota bacterium]
MNTVPMRTRNLITAIAFVLTPLTVFAQPNATTALPPDSARELAPGIRYSHSYVPKSRLSVHWVTVDLRNPLVGVRVGKGLDHVSGLERVYSILGRYDSSRAAIRSVAGTNANFWKAGTLHPMGPTVSDGEIITADKYKNWSSAAFTDRGEVIIDTFNLNVAVRTRLGDIPVSRMNRRVDSAEVVLYTTFFGSSVPFIDTTGIREASRDTITDETEAAIDTMILAMMDSVWSVSPESGTLKLQFRYLREPRANTIVPCRITALDTGFVAIPEDGGVLSFGRGPFPLFTSLFVGDTFTVSSRLQPIVAAPVVQMTGGTPRIVRNGGVSVEWAEEGLKKVRFVEGHYGRSAIGVSRYSDTLIMMTVEPYNRKARTRGASLETLAKLMIARGAWNAMNLDGGSSATMVVEGSTAVPRAGNRGSRKISTALMVFQRLGGVTGHETFPRPRKIMRLE